MQWVGVSCGLQHERAGVDISAPQALAAATAASQPAALTWMDQSISDEHAAPHPADGEMVLGAEDDEVPPAAR